MKKNILKHMLQIAPTQQGAKLVDILSPILCNDDVTSSIGLTDREIASECIMDGNYGSACNHIREAIYEAFEDVECDVDDFIGYRFYDISEHLSCKKISADNYSFERKDILEYILQAIKANQLNIGRISFNDVLDPLLALFVQKMQRESSRLIEKKYFSLFEKCINGFRASCLVADKGDKNPVCDNQLMWAHYAGKHTGIAVKYRLNTQSLPSNRGSQTFCKLLKVNYSDVAIGLDDLTIQDAFRRKTTRWQYENEYRLVYFSGESRRDFVPIDVQVEGVYLGAHISKENQQRIVGFLRGTGIPIYKMLIENDNILKLYAKQIAID